MPIWTCCLLRGMCLGGMCVASYYLDEKDPHNNRTTSTWMPCTKVVVNNELDIPTAYFISQNNVTVSICYSCIPRCFSIILLLPLLVLSLLVLSLSLFSPSFSVSLLLLLYLLLSSSPGLLLLLLLLLLSLLVLSLLVLSLFLPLLRVPLLLPPLPSSSLA